MPKYNISGVLPFTFYSNNKVILYIEQKPEIVEKSFRSLFVQAACGNAEYPEDASAAIDYKQQYFNLRNDKNGNSLF